MWTRRRRHADGTQRRLQSTVTHRLPRAAYAVGAGHSKHADVFVPMEKFTSGGSMLNLQPSTYLRLWEWREDKVNLIGATQSITVRMRYEKVLPELTVGTDPVQIRSATDPLAFAAAALRLVAWRSGTRTGFARRRTMATENLIERYVRPEQQKGRRRMPYGYHRRMIYL